jgi:hypothetical protein
MDPCGMNSGKFRSRLVFFTNLSSDRGENGLSPPALRHYSSGISLALITCAIQLEFKY